MGLYLAVFDGDEEVDGVEVGPYADFGNLRDYVVRNLEDGRAGARFPIFIIHSDCDGEWSVSDCTKLRAELAEIIAAMKAQPPLPLSSKWQKDVARSIGLTPKTAYESFIDVDGEFVLERILHLATVALERQLPILFQ
jgi:Immunity protein 70